MKPLHLFVCTAVLSLLFLNSCRELNGELTIPGATATEDPEYSAFDGEPQNPPKDKPKDYDDWRFGQK